MVEVHNFKVWDIKSGDWVFPPSKRTAEYIKAANGEVIAGTSETIAESSIDPVKGYIPKEMKDKNA